MRKLFPLVVVAAVSGCAMTHHKTKDPDERMESRVERIQDNARRAANLSAWSLPSLNPFVWGATIIKTRTDQQRITEEVARFREEVRQRERERVLYRQRKAIRQDFGPSVMDGRLSLETRQQWKFGRPRVDLVRLKAMIESQDKKQKAIDLRNEALREGDKRRRERLLANDRDCRGCKRCPCLCPVPIVARQQLRDEPTRIPITFDGEMVVEFTETGFDRVNVLRLPPERQRVRARCGGCGHCASCTARPDDLFDGPAPPTPDDDPPPRPGRSDRLPDETSRRPRGRSVVRVVEDFKSTQWTNPRK